MEALTLISDIACKEMKTACLYFDKIAVDVSATIEIDEIEIPLGNHPSEFFDLAMVDFHLILVTAALSIYR